PPVPGVSPRTLCRVQPDLRPRHCLRPEDGRSDRVHPDVSAASGPLPLRLPSATRNARGRAVRGLSEAARLGRRRRTGCVNCQVYRPLALLPSAPRVARPAPSGFPPTRQLTQPVRLAAGTPEADSWLQILGA